MVILLDIEARKRQNRKTYDKIRKSKGLSFRPLKTHRGTFRIWYPLASYPLYRKQLPIGDFPRSQLEHMCKNKFVQWVPAMEYLWCSESRIKYPIMVDCPFVVLDVDLPYEEVVSKLDKWEFGKKTGFSIARSVGGKNCHIHVWLDFSEIPREPAAYADEEHYRVTDRYRLLQKVKQAAATTLFQQTGIEVDSKALGRDEIAVSPSEISEVNKYWAGKTPILVSSLFKDVKGAIKAKRQAYATSKKMAPMAGELRRFLEDPVSSQLVRTWAEENGMRFTKKICKTDYFEKTRLLLLKNIDSVIAHWAESPILSFLKSKESDISIEWETVNQKVFGITSNDCRSYMRCFAMYIWNLEITEQYIYKKRTAIYAVNKDANTQEKIYFDNDFLREHWYAVDSSDEPIPLKREALAAALGNGNTYNTLEREIPRLVSAFGPHRAKEIVDGAIDDSSANNKGKRKSDSRRYIGKLADWWGMDANSTGRVKKNVRIKGSTPDRHSGDGPLAGRVPSGGLFDSQLAGREEADAPVFRPPFQYAGRTSLDDGGEPPEKGRPHWGTRESS